jgi:phenylacetate-CoA ligase
MPEGLFSLILDTRRAMRGGKAAIAERQRKRLAEMVEFARAHSRVYRELYQGLPDRIEDPAVLPVTNKKMSMARFDDWVTDPAVKIAEVRSFVEDPERIGDPFLGKYTIATTSGTTGNRGIFLLDARTFAVTGAIALRLLSTWLSFWDVLKIIFRGGRMAIVMAGGGHFASAVAAARLRKGSKRRAKRIQTFPVGTPLPELVAQLNQFQPAILTPYASMAALLASEQEAGRLKIRPVLLTLSAEGLPLREYDRIAKAFNAKVGNSYAATEVTFLSYSCEHDWLHVNADWVIVEPVDADYRPTPPGVQSHSVLVTNLANRIQPIIRYDLGDSVLQKPEPCPCGNPLPAIRVQGRAADVLTFTNDRGEKIAIAPLAFGILVERIQAIELFQLVQTDPKTLRLRLRIASNVDRERVWQEVFSGLKHLLGEHGVHNVSIVRGTEEPELTRGGKYRQIIPLS